ncbi:MAG: MBL fold metallo-hydrolase [Clostridia bacterium]|nr:MBL fold metallo-hydrolase [Clostridia bacterium]
MKKLKIVSVLTLAVLFLIIGVACVPTEDTQLPDTPSETDKPVIDEPEVIVPPAVENSSTFEVHFIDVGQADASLILCDGKSMLIDGGNVEDSNLIYSYLKKNEVTHLNYVVATHAHEDHVGGLSGALNFATVDTVYCPVKSYSSDAFNNFVKNVEKRNAEITVPEVNSSFLLGSAEVVILACNSTDDTNNSSIVLKITYGETSFLFTADAEREAEEIILEQEFDLSATVLKVGHHGSENSTTYPFLREIMPEYAVISVGKNNSYGHPTEEALSRLRDADVKVFRTDLQGDIICTSGGKTVSFTVDRNADADTLVGIEKETDTVSPTPDAQPEKTEAITTDYIGNINTEKFHYPDCSSVKRMKESNKYYFTGTREEIIAEGYEPCGNCNP